MIVAPVGLQRPVARARRSRRSRATASASTSRTSCPSDTSVHWHGILLPNGMDGVGGLDAAAHRAGRDVRLRVHAAAERHVHVPPALGRDGPDGDGHDGLLRHPSAATRRSRRSTATSSFMLHEWDIEPGTRRRTPTMMTGLQPLHVQQPRVPGHRPAGRAARASACASAFGNLPMDNHPIHMHGYDFEVTGTDGGGVPRERAGPRRRSTCPSGRRARSSSSPTSTGDWAFHCHKSHHTMNAMGHDVPNMHRRRPDAASRSRIRTILPGYMAMGENGMGEMGIDGDGAARRTRCR